MVLAVTILPQALATSPLEVEAGGIEEGQREIGEEVSPPGKQSLLHFILGLPKPAHRPIQVMQLQPFCAREHNIPPPTLGRPVRARHKQAVKHRQVNSPLYGELKGAGLEKVIEGSLYSRSLPQPPEDKVWAQLLGCPLFQVSGLHQLHFLAEACQRTQEGINGASSGQLVQPAQGEQHSLHGTVALAAVLYQLEVTVRSAGFDAEEQAVYP